jgi:predicted permease
METLLKDIKFAVRGLLKRPGFTLIVVLTLALGIGANAALFSVVNGVLLNPLPYEHAEQLVTLHQSKPNFETGAIPFPNFQDWQRDNQTFSSMAISRGTGFSLIDSGEPERVTGRYVTTQFFDVLGLKPVLGRSFLEGEDQQGVQPVVVISDRLWHRKFAASADILKQSISLNDKSYAVVGVMPADFSIARSSDVFVPIGQWNNAGLKNRGAALGLHGIGRMKPGVSIEQASADLNRIMSNLAVTFPETNRGNGAKLVALKSRVIGDIGPTLLLLFGAVGFVLLIACVNVSNLMLVRTSGRSREFAVRAALGASRTRLLRECLTESTLLAVMGGGVGLLVAAWATQAVLKLLPSALPRAEEIRLDGRVLLFTFVVSLLTGLFAGAVPAMRSIRGSLSETLKEGGRGASGLRHRAQSAMVAVEMALALVLLIGAGLMVRSLAALWNVNPGFSADNVMTFNVNLAPSLGSAEPGVVRNTIHEISDKLATIPGVRANSLVSGATPLQGEDDVFFWIDGQPKPASQSEMNMSLIYVVEPDYLSVMGIPLRQGRFFTKNDNERSQPVAVIDEALANKYFGAESPLGKRINITGQDTPYQIIGVVGHIKQWSIANDDENELQSQLYVPLRSLADDSLPGAFGVALRYDGNPDELPPALFAGVREVVSGQNSHNIISRPQTMNSVIAGSLADRRFSMILLGSFAGVSLLLASMGIYGVISYLVRQRTHELGIRIALGAQRKDVVSLVLRHGMKMALAGIVLGLVAASGLTRLLTNLVYGVSTTDPATFLGITLLLALVALVACFVPAWRATKVDPLIALRNE